MTNELKSKRCLQARLHITRHPPDTVIHAHRSNGSQKSNLVAVDDAVIPDTVRNPLTIPLGRIMPGIVSRENRHQFQGTVQPVDVMWEGQTGCGICLCEERLRRWFVHCGGGELRLDALLDELARLSLLRRGKILLTYTEPQGFLCPQ